MSYHSKGNQRKANRTKKLSRAAAARITAVQPLLTWPLFHCVTVSNALSAQPHPLCSMRMEATCWRILVATLTVLKAIAVPIEEFYPFGLSDNKQILTNDDGSSLEIHLDPPLKFSGRNYNTCHVSNLRPYPFLLCGVCVCASYLLHGYIQYKAGGSQEWVRGYSDEPPFLALASLRPIAAELGYSARRNVIRTSRSSSHPRYYR